MMEGFEFFIWQGNVEEALHSGTRESITRNVCYELSRMFSFTQKVEISMSSGGNPNKTSCPFHMTVCRIPVLLLALMQPKSFMEKL